jgi:hypothetical protein
VVNMKIQLVLIFRRLLISTTFFFVADGFYFKKDPPITMGGVCDPSPFLPLLVSSFHDGHLLLSSCSSTDSRPLVPRPPYTLAPNPNIDLERRHHRLWPPPPPSHFRPVVALRTPIALGLRHLSLGHAQTRSAVEFQF